MDPAWVALAIALVAAVGAFATRAYGRTMQLVNAVLALAAVAAVIAVVALIVD